MKDVLEYLAQKIQDDRLRMVEDLGEGKAKDHAEYKFSCGVVKGLLMANNHILELTERLEKSDE
jgi:hypothetical protein